MNTQLVAGLSILVLLIGITSVTGVHYATAKGMPIHNPNWASIAASPTSQNGHAPACCNTEKHMASTNTPAPKTPDVAKTIDSTQVQKNKDTNSQDSLKTKPQQQKINRDNQIKSESTKIASDKSKSDALIKASTHNSDIKVNQKPKQ